MRILMLLENEFLRDPRVEKEVHSLYTSGHEIIVAAVNRDSLPPVEKRDDCLVLRKSISKFVFKSGVGALKVPVYLNFWRRFVRDILASHTVDAIHVHDLPLAIVGIEAGKKYKIKMILDLHENWPALLNVSAHTNTFAGRLLSSERQWRDYEKKCASGADAVITVVQEMKERIIRLGVAPEKIIVLENTPMQDEINILKFNRDSRFFTLLYVGGISFHRGLQYVIEGMSMLPGEIPARLWIAGDGKFLPVLKEMAEKHGLKEQVRFFGNLPKDKVMELMVQADYGLVPHIRSEQSDNSSPNKLFEYMAAGLPVIASDCISVKRIIDETCAGTTYQYDSPSDFADVVKELYHDDNISGEYSANGINSVRTRYNWAIGSEALKELYKGLQTYHIK